MLISGLHTLKGLERSAANEKIIDVVALLAIDPTSVDTLKRILAEARRSNSYDIADELAHAKVLPAALAPDLRKAIATSQDPRFRRLYIEALKQTHAPAPHAVSPVSKAGQG